MIVSHGDGTTRRAFLQNSLMLAGAPLLVSAAAVPAEAIILETPLFRYAVSEAGVNLSLHDGATEYLQTPGGTAVASIVAAGARFDSTAVRAERGQWRFTFGESGVVVLVRPQPTPAGFSFEVTGVEGGDFSALTFPNLTLLPHPAAGLEWCCLALNLQANVGDVPGPMTQLQAIAYASFGVKGTKSALVAAPRGALRAGLQQTLEAEPSLSHSKLGGPWALDAPITRGSYLIDTEGQVGEATVDAWIELAHNLGMRQIDLHTGKSMRFGELAPDPTLYPNGLDGVRAVVDKLHAAGLVAGLHTYAFFVSKQSPWVTPVPDPRLAVAHTFTLAGALDAAATTVPVLEDTAAISTVTGFQIRNSVTLHIGEELVVFTGVSGSGFTGCERGAHDTTAAAHPSGTQVRHLKECFGLFLPDGESALFAEVAARTAEVYNACGFDMIYLDALDGADLVAGGELGWHYAAKFVDTLNRGLGRPALIEMSTFGHHLWRWRSRMGAWDVPLRGMKRLVAVHARVNEASAANFLPANLGWAGIFDWNPVQPERTFPDDVEFLCCTALAHDASLSLLVGFTPEQWKASSNVRRLGGIIRRYEELRLSGLVPESIRRQLRSSGSEFTLELDASGSPAFVPVQIDGRVIHGENAWTINNPFQAQVAGIRIEALIGTAEYAGPLEPVIAGFSGLLPYADSAAVEGVTPGFSSTPETTPAGEPSALFSATNSTPEPRNAWASSARLFDPPLDLNQCGLALWVKGDGQGALLNVQVQSPADKNGGYSDHYVDLDFTGWKRVILVEPESRRIAEFGWPHSPRHADGEPLPFPEALRNYIIWPDHAHISRLSFWLNNIPRGATVACHLGPVHRVSLKPAELMNPAITVNGVTHTFPVTLHSGEYLECSANAGARIYDAKGEMVREVDTDLPRVQFAAGRNAFTSSGPGRARVTCFTRGEPLIG